MLMVEIKEIPTFYIRQEVHYRKESYHELLDNWGIEYSDWEKKEKQEK